MDPGQLTANIMSASVAPVFLISAVALLVSCMTTRYGRVIDRTRLLLRDGNKLYGRYADANHVQKEMRDLYRRAKILRLAIILGGLSIFLTVAAILFLFINLRYHFFSALFSEMAFALSLITLLISVGLFIEDFAISLGSLRNDIDTRGDQGILDQEQG